MQDEQRDLTHMCILALACRLFLMLEAAGGGEEQVAGGTIVEFSSLLPAAQRARNLAMFKSGTTPSHWVCALPPRNICPPRFMVQPCSECCPGVPGVAPGGQRCVPVCMCLRLDHYLCMCPSRCWWSSRRHGWACGLLWPVCVPLTGLAQV